MLYSQFFIDEDRYVISAREIVEIIPFVMVKSTPTLPDYVAGLINYHGESVPVVDLCRLLIGRSSRKKLSTRIIIVDKINARESPMRLGFIVEKATEMLMIDEDLFKPQAMKNLESPTNGPVAACQEFLVEKISVITMFDRIDQRLFREEGIPHSEPLSK